MSFNTGNPLGSKDILDLYDNSENIDQFVNSQLDEHPDRFGVKRLTLAGLIKRSMALRNEINDFSGALTFRPEWSDVPMNISEGVGGEGGALNLQAEALGNRVSILSSAISFNRVSDLKTGINSLGVKIDLANYPVNTKIGWMGYHYPGDGGSNWGVLKHGEHVDNGLSIFSLSPSIYVEANLKGKSINVLKAGAKGDGITDDTIAIQTALDHVTAHGGKLTLPTRTYVITKSLTIDTGDFGKGVIVEGHGRNTVIKQVGVGEDGVKWSTTQFLQNSVLRDLKITCSVDSGHCINIVYGCVTNLFDNVELEQYNPNKSVLYGDWTVLGGGVYDTKFRGGSWSGAHNSLVSPVKFLIKGTIFNENIFEGLRCYHSFTVQFFQILCVGGDGYWITNNVWRNINFEICRGGGFYGTSMKNCLLEGLSFWDVGSDPYSNHLIAFEEGAGYESVCNTLVNCSRNGDRLHPQVYDIYVSSGEDFTFINCHISSGAKPQYNFGGKRGVVIGHLFGLAENHTSLTIISSVSGIRFPRTMGGASLSHYDEGNWTAKLEGGVSNPTIPVSVTGRWQRIGNTVKVTAAFQVVVVTGAAGVIKIAGLPFAVGPEASCSGSVATSSMGEKQLTGLFIPGAEHLVLVECTDVGKQVLYPAGSKITIHLSLSYMV